MKKIILSIVNGEKCVSVPLVMHVFLKSGQKSFPIIGHYRDNSVKIDSSSYLYKTVTLFSKT